MRVIQIVGYKKTGKTTLVCRLAERLAAEGRRVGTAKHDGHDFDPDVPGTDSRKHREAGALVTAVVSASRTAFFEERTSSLDEVLGRMSAAVDVALVEGWKRERYPKLLLAHDETQLALLRELTGVAAVVTWKPELTATIEAAAPGVPVLPYDATDQILDLLRLREGILD
ncbi:molybdopterin-guanine dinucleotide biosynthesis protein B [Paenibacillus sp. TRM 82003]|nr:molybdopterin-guanine dinucleotide biosynthesis protein B [Paenibacillus sp. TRM 82003]